MIEVKNIKEFSLSFETGSGKAFVSMMQWPTGDGWSISVVEDGEMEKFEASDEMLDALLNLHVYASTYKEKA